MPGITDTTGATSKIFYEEDLMEKQKPTYEEKLQALKESISNWEEVAKDLKGRSCPLCNLVEKYGGVGGTMCTVGCPIWEKTGFVQCRGTPYWTWAQDATKENALAEVVFLKNLHIEMLEKKEEIPEICVDCKEWIGPPKGCKWKGPCERVREKEKKEEWVEITRDLTWEHTRRDGFGSGILEIFYCGDIIGHFGVDDLYVPREGYKAEISHGHNFRILRKV